MELTLRRQLCGAKQNKKQTPLDTDADRSRYLVSKYKGEGQASRPLEVRTIRGTTRRLIATENETQSPLCAIA